MITNELIKLLAIKYRGTAGDVQEKEFIFGTGAISYIEKEDERYVIHLQGDNSLYFISERESVQKLENFIKSNVM